MSIRLLHSLASTTAIIFPTYASLVQQAERTASEGGETHAKDGADVAIHGRRDDAVL